MNEPRRLKHASPELARLLESKADHRASDGLRADLLRALSEPSSVVVGPATQPAPNVAGGARLWISSAAIVAIAVAGSLVYQSREPALPAVVDVQPEVPLRQAADVASFARPLAPVPIAKEPTALASEPLAQAKAASSPLVGRRGGRPAAAAALERELQLLGAAKAALSRREGDQALALLAQYFRAFPQGVLQEEAHVLRVVAFQSRGERERARAAGADFLARRPGSVLAPRVKAVMHELADSRPPETQARD
jgi:hypothetical protein